MSVVVITIQRGRHGHLRQQIGALAASAIAPTAHVVVSMDVHLPDLPGADVVHMPVSDGQPLPLAAARNRGIDHAAASYAPELVVLLDVDCLPAPTLVGDYREAASRRPGAVLCGTVRYLRAAAPATGAWPSEQEQAEASNPPARPLLPPGATQPLQRPELFWSLSFAAAPQAVRRAGGFDEAYVGYGAEDTDFGRRATRAGVPLYWLGGAEAFHLHHPVSSPPVEHIADIVRNARVYRERWGTWPMEGWLATFRDDGLIAWEPDGSALSLTRAGERCVAVAGRLVTS